MIGTRIQLYFPEQATKPAHISKMIRQNKVFKGFVRKRSRDMRYITLDFENTQKKDVMLPLLLQSLDKLEYDYRFVGEGGEEETTTR